MQKLWMNVCWNMNDFHTVSLSEILTYSYCVYFVIVFLLRIIVSESALTMILTFKIHGTGSS